MKKLRKGHELAKFMRGFVDEWSTKHILPGKIRSHSMDTEPIYEEPREKLRSKLRPAENIVKFKVKY